MKAIVLKVIFPPENKLAQRFALKHSPAKSNQYAWHKRARAFFKAKGT
jgi:hypothetical protein